MPIWLKYLISAGLVVLISEVAARSDRAGAVIGALPWLTTLVMVWLFVEKQGDEKIANHARPCRCFCSFLTCSKGGSGFPWY